MTTAPESCCSHRAPGPRPSRLSWGALLSGLALALLPKCPLCIAAYLTVLGLGTGAAGALAQVLHPLTLFLAAVILGLFVMRLARRAQRFATARIPGA
jgi:hypothetical protein